ncbi:hypothetical protein ACJX0J_002969 (mitochondrion) [Zea mays]
MNAEVSFIAFSGFLHSWPASLIIALERKVNQSQGKVNFLIEIRCCRLKEEEIAVRFSLSTHYIEYNIYYYYYKYFYFLGVGMRARYEHANFFESTIGEKIRGYVLEGGYIFPIVSIAQPRNGQGFLLYPLDLNDPISNLVGDSLSGFDVYSIQQSEVEEKKEEKELGSLLNRAS